MRTAAKTGFPLSGTLEDLFFARDNSKTGHVEEEPMFDYADNGVELGRHSVRFLDEKPGAVENQIAFVGYVPFAVRSYANRWREAKVA